MKATITKALLRDLAPLPPGVTKARVFDDRLAGFIAEQRQGGVTFYLRYADERRRTREAKLGRLGDVTLDQARKAAERIRSQVSLGEDPMAERDRRRAVPTLAAFFEDRYLPYVRERLASVREVERYFRLRILPAFGSRGMDEVTPADVAGDGGKEILSEVTKLIRGGCCGDFSVIARYRRCRRQAVIDHVVLRDSAEIGYRPEPAVVQHATCAHTGSPSLRRFTTVAASRSPHHGGCKQGASDGGLKANSCLRSGAESVSRR